MKTPKKKKFFIALIIFIGILIFIVIASGLYYWNKTKTIGLKIQPSSTTKKWVFSSNQYEVSVSNVIYSNLPERGYGFSYDLTFKNISISPMIIFYQISDCIVTKNGNSTRFTANSPYDFPKGLLPGESLQIKTAEGFGGEDYDESGNKVYPSPDLRIKTCKIQPKTPDEKLGLPLHPVVGEPPKQTNLIEPKIITLSN